MISVALALQFPIEYQRVKERPKSSTYCKAEYAFCPTGNPNGTIPLMKDDDIIEIYSLQAPVWEFVTGNLMAHFVSLELDYVYSTSRKTEIVSVTLERLCI
jgi:hypothetical protein